jgi:hypothetical protein
MTTQVNLFLVSGAPPTFAVPPPQRHLGTAVTFSLNDSEAVMPPYDSMADSIPPADDEAYVQQGQYLEFDTSEDERPNYDDDDAYDDHDDYCTCNNFELHWHNRPCPKD